MAQTERTKNKWKKLGGEFWPFRSSASNSHPFATNPEPAQTHTYSTTPMWKSRSRWNFLFCCFFFFHPFSSCCSARHSISSTGPLLLHRLYPVQCCVYSYLVRIGLYEYINKSAQRIRRAHNTVVLVLCVTMINWCCARQMRGTGAERAAKANRAQLGKRVVVGWGWKGTERRWLVAAETFIIGLFDLTHTAQHWLNASKLLYGCRAIKWLFNLYRQWKMVFWRIFHILDIFHRRHETHICRLFSVAAKVRLKWLQTIYVPAIAALTMFVACVRSVCLLIVISNESHSANFTSNSRCVCVCVRLPDERTK